MKLTLLYDIFKRFPFLFLGNVLLLAAVNLIGVMSIFSVAPVVDYFLHPDFQDVSALTRKAAEFLMAVGLSVTLKSFLGVFLFFQVLKNGFSILTRYLLIKTRFSVIYRLMLETFQDFLGARWAFFSSSQQGTLLNTFSREFNTASTAFGALASFFASILQVGFYLSVPFYISWEVTTVGILSALVLALPFLLLGKLSYRLGKQSTSTNNEVSNAIQESLGAVKVILGFGNQEKSLRIFRETTHANFRANLRSQTLDAATPLVYEPLGLMVVVVALLVAQELAVPLAEMVVLLWALRNTVPVIGGIAAQRNMLMNFAPSYEQIQSLRTQAQELKQRSGDRPFRGFEREISVENLSFAYAGHEPTLANVSLTIPKGRMVAIVGPSGAGKSTLIDTIMGFNEPAQGRITFDGVPLEAFDINAYRQRIGYVPQDSVLFNMTIRDNMRWAREEATDGEIEDACRLANADEFIRELGQGYGTRVGDRGVRLSGGQCQRIALARAILRKPDLLILDEATSALDTHSERLIQSAIEDIARETTVIVIAHRLSTIVNADYIYVLHKGRVVEEGTYEALVGQEGPFSRMTQLQVLEVAG